jgi:transcriptional regulator with XRE-family HTH domain
MVRVMAFAENLRSELDYQDMIVKQLAAKTGINIHTLNHYLSGKKSMPPADAAVKIALALGVTVEYLVTGSDGGVSRNGGAAACPRFPERGKKTAPGPDRRYETLVENLKKLPEGVQKSITAMVDTIARHMNSAGQ